MDIHGWLQDYPLWKKDILCDGNNTKEIQSKAFSINCICEIANRTLAVNGLKHSINIHNIHTGEIELSLSGHEDLVRVLIELPDGKIASGCELGTIKIWHLQNGVCERTCHKLFTVL